MGAKQLVCSARQRLHIGHWWSEIALTSQTFSGFDTTRLFLLSAT
jgi:hypothetical protein